MKGDSCVHPATKWRAQSPGAKISRKLMAIRMNNFFDERPPDSDSGIWPVKEVKKRRSRRPRPLTATLARPRLLDITLLGKIDMSLMTKELLSVYRLMRVPMEAHRANIARMRDKKNALKEISSGNKQKTKNNVVIEITQAVSEEHEKAIIKKDIIKDKSSFKLFPGLGLAARNRSKVDEVFSGQPNKPLPKPCDSCGRASRPERLHAHPQRGMVSPTRVKVSPASARRSTTNDALSVNALDKLNHLSINRASSSCERRRSPNRKTIEDSEKTKEEHTKRLVEAPPVCTYCGKRFGTSSHPIHEAKCRLKHSKKNVSNKISNESNSDNSRESVITSSSPRKLSGNELLLPKNNTPRSSSPRRKDDNIKDKDDESYIFHPSLHPPVRRSPINMSARNKADDDVSQSEISDVEYSTKETTGLECEVEWKTHLKSLIKCNNCERAFAPERIHRHQAVCDGSSKRLSLNNNVNTRKIRIEV